MTERWILNASPLIVLARVGYEDLCLKLADSVVVPQAVATEIEAGPERDPARQVLAARRFDVVETPPPTEEVLAWNLEAGETAVISLGLAQSGQTLILDDGAARRCARSLGLNIKGTLAVVTLAKQRGLIPSAAAVLRLLRSTGFRIDDETIHRALASTVGEVWT